MATPFESFVQLELGKRPFTPEDGTEETILIRRGPGPRQITQLLLEEGQFLGMVDGKLVGVDAPQGGGGGIMYTHRQGNASATWVVMHEKDSTFFTTMVFVDGRMVIPDQVIIDDENQVTISFSMAVIGHATFFFDPAP